jgi:hypothetical protein
MVGKQGGWRTLSVLFLATLAQTVAFAGPDCRDCPRSDYPRLHYWAPTLFLVRAYVHPSNLDQYPPGPCPYVPPSYEITKYKCRTIPPTPTAPYADPASYYGRPTSPP